MKKKISSLKEFLIHEIRGLYDSERKLKTYLQHHIKSVSSKDLRNVLTSYLENAENRINKLQWIFKYLDEKIEGRSSECMAVLLKDNADQIKNAVNGALRDAILTASVQRVLRYKMSVYGTCQAVAGELRMHDIAEIVNEILALEQQVDYQISNLAKAEINEDALAAEIK